MHLLTDVPEAARALPALAEPPVRIAADALPERERAVWRSFGTAGEVWKGAVSNAAFGLDGPLLLVGEAAASQFDRANERLRGGDALPDGLACVALTGARFHGQRGRPWTALRGNLHLTAHLALDVDAAANQAGLAVLPAVAAATAIEEASEGRVRPGLKWVNDLLLDGHKAGGVLTTTHVQRDRVRHAVLGIGVNVAQAPPLPPASRAVPAATLAAFDDAFARPGAWARLLPAVTRHLRWGRERLLAGEAEALVARYRERAAFLGRRVTIWPVEDDGAAPLARGRVLELRSDLSLVLEGVPWPVRTGRMTIDA